jgi:hypothetical protein
LDVCGIGDVIEEVEELPDYRDRKVSIFVLYSAPGAMV